MKICKAMSSADLDAIYPVMKELRPHLTLQKYMELFREAARQNHYEIVGAFEGASCVGVMGYRVLVDFVHGKHLYVDDLVVTAGSRSHGIGAKLLRYAEALARTSGCEGLRLCTGLENEAGKRFYEREGWTARSLAYKKKLSSNQGDR